MRATPVLVWRGLCPLGCSVNTALMPLPVYICGRRHNQVNRQGIITAGRYVQTGRKTGRQPVRKSGRQTGREPASLTGRKSDRQEVRQAENQTGRQPSSQTGRKTVRQADRQPIR